MSKICAIILAAGESKRMKVPKLLLPFNGKKMIELVTDNVLKSGLSFNLVVLGCYSDEISAVIGHLPVKFCYNENYRNGMLSSVICGFKNLPDDFDAVLVFPGDQPFIEPGVTELLNEAFLNTGKGLIMPVYNGRRGHPILIASHYREIIDQIPHNEGLKWLAAEYPEDVYEVNTFSSGILKDFDIEDDYLKEINKRL